MDHVALVAMYDEVRKQQALETAEDISTGAVAAQGDSKGIKKIVKDLRTSAGIVPEQNIADLGRFAGHGRGN